MYICIPIKWRRVRVVEGARLESVYRGNSIKGSNPFVSASSQLYLTQPGYNLNILPAFAVVIDSTSSIEILLISAILVDI